MNLRPPTPGMRDQELVQWFQRVYDAILSLEAEIKNIPTPESIEPPEIPTSHNQLTDNGGLNSHQQIAQHMGSTTAHGADGVIVGRNELLQSLNNLEITLREAIEAVRILRVWEAPIGGGQIPDDVDYVRCFFPGTGLFLRPANEQKGRTLTVDNTSSEDVSLFIIGEEFQVIQGEVQQEIPPDCSVRLVSDGLTWRFA